jgi:hypothetical protein
MRIPPAPTFPEKHLKHTCFLQIFWHTLPNFQRPIKQAKKKSFPIHDPLYKLSILNEIQ